MSYTDPIRLTFKGDRAKCARYVNDVRRLTFNLVRELREAGVLSGRRRFKFMDGTTATVVVAGNIVSATIDTTSDKEQGEERGGIVVWARDDQYPLGMLDLGPPLQLPQQILTYNAKAASWRTYFYSQLMPQYAAFEGKKGTYIRPFPDGIILAGNCDWFSAENVYISWYGPYHRYMLEALVQPRHQFGKQVFMLGTAVLDTDTYASISSEQSHGPDRYILGAALKEIDADWWLYTVQSECLDEPTYVTPPADSMGLAEVCIWPRQDNTGGMYRYKLRAEANEGGTVSFVAEANSRELLTELNDNHCEPWFFNQSCTHAHCFVFPVDGWLLQRYSPNGPASIPLPGGFYDAPFPQSYQVIRNVEITPDGVTVDDSEHVSYSRNGGPCVFARDYKGDEPVNATLEWYQPAPLTESFIQDVAGLRFQVGSNDEGFTNPWTDDGWEWWRFLEATTPYMRTGWSYIVAFDLRKDLLVLMVQARRQITLADPTYFKYQMRVFHRGVQVHIEDMADDIKTPTFNTPTLPSFGGTILDVNFYALSYPPSFFFSANHNIPKATLYDENASPPRYRWYGEYSLGGNIFSMKWFPRDANQYYGAVGSTQGWGTAAFDVAWTFLEGIYSLNPNANDEKDFLIRSCVFSMVADGDAVVISGFRPTARRVGAERFYWFGYDWFYITNGSLPQLTGIGAENDDESFSSYKPIWILGEPPNVPAPP